jgi:hypothetical protein
MKVLIACEESQAVCIEFRKRGHEAYSCDLQECSGGHPEWHIKDDVLNHLNDGWDLMIGHPECTRLTVTANKWYKPEFAHRFPTIHQDRELAVDFFMKLINAPIEKIAIENPIGIMSTRYRKPNQVIQPFQFGDKHRKATCLWLKNLPLLKSTEIVEPEYKLYNSKRGGKSKYPMAWAGKHTSKQRSVTFPGIARAMAEQWSSVLNNTNQITLFK